MEFLKRMYGEHPHSQYLSISLSKNRTFLFVRCKTAAFSCSARAFELRVLDSVRGEVWACDGKSWRSSVARGNTHLILRHVTLLAHKRIQLRCQRRLGRHPPLAADNPPSRSRSPALSPRSLRILIYVPTNVQVTSRSWECWYGVAMADSSDRS